MADANGGQTSHFRWVIDNPFLPLERLVATFYFGVPWKVTLSPQLPPNRQDREIDSWKFEFHLKCILSEVLIRRIEAHWIIVNISINQVEQIEKVKENYVFELENQHEYNFVFDVSTPPRWVTPHCLVIRIDMVYRERHIANEEGYRLEDVLMGLSEDLQRLLSNPTYPDLTLWSNQRLRMFPVHSYIIRERWCNFFVRHGDEIDRNAVELIISCPVLEEILTYVYSARLGIGGEHWGEPSFMTELFKVIDRYELQHLYEVFVRYDSHQLRTTTRDLFIAQRIYRADDAYNEVIKDIWDEWVVYPDTEYQLIFRIQFSLSNNNPICLYILKSRSPKKMHVQVSLEFVKAFIRYNDVRTFDNSVTMLQKDYKLGPREEQNCGTNRLRVNSDDFEEFLGGNVRTIAGTETEHYIRCVLHLSHGTTVIQVENEEGIELQDDIERCSVLSNHMHRLLYDRTHEDDDLRILCNAEQPRYPEPQEVLHYLHQDIFKTRVIGWETILGTNHGDLVILAETSEVFHLILVYIYTGKVYDFPVRYFNEIQDFAIRGEMELLERILEEMRWNWANRVRSYSPTISNINL